MSAEGNDMGVIELFPNVSFAVRRLPFRLDPRRDPLFQPSMAEAGVDNLAGERLASRLLCHFPDAC